MTMELSDIIGLYLENLDLKAVSVNSYRSILGTYQGFLKNNGILHPKRTDVIHYREYLRNRGSKAATIQKQMIVIKSFYKWARINCRNYGIAEDFAFDIAEGIRGAKIEATYKKEPLDVNQARRLIETAYGYANTIQGARNYAMVILMLVTGLRAIEVSRALRSDLSTMDGSDILYIQGKGRDDKDLFVKLPTEVMTGIHHYLQMRTDQDNHLFVSHSPSVKIGRAHV